MQAVLIICLTFAMASTALGFNGQRKLYHEGLKPFEPGRGILHFNGQRKGFILGGGLGFGLTSFTQTVDSGGLSATSDRENNAAFQTDVKIGFGPSEQVLVYLSWKTSWFNFDNVLDESVTIAMHFGGVGISYYFKPAAPSPYVSGGLGYCAWEPLIEASAETYIGYGLAVGGGYEFSGHWSVEGDLMWGKPSKEILPGLDESFNTLTIRVAIVGVAY